MQKIHYHRAPVTVTLTKLVPTDDGRGRKSVPNGTRTAEVLIEINLHDLVRFLGEKAVRNKSRKARGLGGIIKVSAQNIVDQPNPVS